MLLLGSVVMQALMIRDHGVLMKYQGTLIQDLEKKLEQCVNAPAVDESRVDIFKKNK